MSTEASDLAFYQDLIAFQDFSEVSADQHFKNVPDSWWVVLSDVKGSTKAIQEGRYKQVNMIGASSISCVLNALGTYEFPFVFGGDGSTVVIPAQYIEKVSSQLCGLQALAKNEFDIELRIGLVAIKSLYDQGYLLKIGKYQMSPGNCLAQFKGSALTRAEAMVKNNEPGAVLLKQEGRNDQPDLEGLSCRLSPVKSKNGVILSVLCQPRIHEAHAQVHILKEIISSFRKILNGDFNSARPTNNENIRWKWVPDTLTDEISLQQKKSPYILAFVRKLFWILLVNGSLIFNFSMGKFFPKKYKAELILNSDFKKYDETLRMVIDCSAEQVQEIKGLLNELYDNKKIFYGFHESKDALVTCMVSSASNNQHVHFIDGGSGGYAMAAVQLKKQMKV